MKKFDHGEILRIANEILEVSGHIKNIIDEIESERAILASGNVWSSPASQVVSQKFGSVTYTFDEVYQGLVRSGNFLQIAVSNRKKLESQLSSFGK